MKEKVSKRILGFISYMIAFGMSICSGFEWYAPESTIIIGIFASGSVLLGIDAWGHVKNNQIAK
jgi:hypothetical protein